MPGKPPMDMNEPEGSQNLHERIARLEAGMQLMMQELELIRKKGSDKDTAQVDTTQNDTVLDDKVQNRDRDPNISAPPAGSDADSTAHHRQSATGTPLQSRPSGARSPLHPRPAELWKPPAKVPGKESVNEAGFVPGPKKTIDLQEWLTTENLINKVGIGLLLFGVAFLFKYSIDQGWLTPPVRLSFGVLLGIVLLVGGNRTYQTRRTFSLALLGGAIATFYITGFASYQIFELTSRPVTFAFMVAITMLAFFISLRQKDAVLSVIGTLGGLMTPFILMTDTVSLIWLVIYATTIIAGTSAIYYVKGWRSVLWVTVITGSVVYALGTGMTSSALMNPGGAGTWVLQGGILMSWLLLGVMPVFREQFRITSFTRPYVPDHSETGSGVYGRPAEKSGPHLLILTVLMPLITLGLSVAVWTLSENIWGWIFFGASAIYGLLALVLYRPEKDAMLWYMHALTGILLLTFGILLMFKGHWLFFLLAAEAVVLYLAGDRFRYESLKNIAHTLMAIVAVWMTFRLSHQAGESVFLNPKALTDIAVISIAAFMAWCIDKEVLRKIYLLAVHIALLILAYRELAILDHGMAYISIAWGVYAIGLMVTGLQLRNVHVSQTGMVTLLVVVAKLFMIDLATVDALWRVLLFLGFGGVLLLLSYYFRPLWKNPDTTIE